MKIFKFLMLAATVAVMLAPGIAQASYRSMQLGDPGYDQESMATGGTICDSDCVAGGGPAAAMVYVPDSQ